MVITGAANGIGRATADVFAAEGAMVVLADVDAALAPGIRPRNREYRYFIYQSTLHVPLIIHWPTAKTRIPARVDSPGGLIDLTPTILAAVQLPTPASMKRGSLLKRQEEDVYSESIYPQKHFGVSPLASLRRGRYKLIDAPRPELFDLVEDPAEGNNLSAAKQSVVAALRERLKRLRETHQPPAKKPERTFKSGSGGKTESVRVFV